MFDCSIGQKRPFIVPSNALNMSIKGRTQAVLGRFIKKLQEKNKQANVKFPVVAIKRDFLRPILSDSFPNIIGLKIYVTAIAETDKPE